jgi:hypothetical protein
MEKLLWSEVHCQRQLSRYLFNARTQSTLCEFCDSVKSILTLDTVKCRMTVTTRS